MLSGTPTAGTGGGYAVTFTASNGVGSNASQNFTLTVNQAPVFTSGAGATFAIGSPGFFTVTATGTPAPSTSESGVLPSGVTFNSSSGALSGTPGVGTGGSYTINNPIHYTDPNGKDWGTAWNDVKTFAGSVYVKLTVGFGAEVKANAGPVELKAGGAVKVSAEQTNYTKTGTADTTLSKSVEAGVTASAPGVPGSPALGYSRGASQVVGAIHNDGTLTGAENPTQEKVTGLGTTSTSVSGSGDEIGVGVEGGVLLIGGVDAGATRSGWSALGNVPGDFIFGAPPTPPQPTPPPAPTEPTQDESHIQKCQDGAGSGC